jgi:hypothetical protein
LKKYYLILCILVAIVKAEAQHSFCIPYKKNNLWGICDTNGKVMLAPTYNSFSTFCIGQNTLISFKKNSKIDVYLNGKLQPQLSNQFDSIKRASYSADGTFFIYNKGKMGLVENGKLQIQPIYDSLDFNNNNRIIAKKNKLYGLISTANKIIIPILYDEVEPDWDENQRAEKNSPSFYWVAKKGIKTQYITDAKQKPIDYFYDDEEPMMVYEVPNGREAENKNRENELEEEFATAKVVNILSSSFYVTNEDGLMGVYNYLTKNIIVPLEFDSIKMHEIRDDANYCTVYKNGKVGFYNGYIDLFSVKYDSINTDEIERGFIFPSINNLQGLNILTDEMDLNIKPTFSKIKYYNRFKVNEDWIFCLFEITDTLGNTYFMGENKKEYFSK